MKTLLHFLCALLLATVTFAAAPTVSDTVKRDADNVLLGYLKLNNGVVDVRNYGALGDGTTDDTAAIASAITAAGANGVVFFNPGKTYIVSSLITIALDNVVLSGYGAKLKTSAQSQYAIFAISGRTGVQFRGLTFDSSYASGAALVDTGQIDVTASARTAIVDCTFQNTRSAGIRFIGTASDGVVRGCRFLTYSAGIYTNLSGSTQPTNLRIHDNYFGTPITGTTSAITMHGTAAAPYGGHDIRGNVIEGTVTMGIELQTSVSGCVVVGNVIRNALTGISLADSDDMVASENVISASTYYGIEVAGSDRASLSGNLIKPTIGTAIGVISASVDTSVSGGVLQGGSYGVYCNSSALVISGVSFKNQTAQSVYLHGATSVSILSNQMVGNSSTASFVMLDATSTAVSKVVVSGNRFLGTTGDSCIGLYTPNGLVISDVLVAHNVTTGCSFPAGAFSTGASINRDTSLVRIRCRDNLGSGGDFAGNYDEDLNAFVWSNSIDRTGFYDHFVLDGGLMKNNASSGAISVRLPNSTGLAGYTATFTKTDSSGNAVTLTTYSSQTISGTNAAGSYVSATTYSLATQGARVTVQSDGSNWVIIQSN